MPQEQAGTHVPTIGAGEPPEHIEPVETDEPEVSIITSQEELEAAFGPPTTDSPLVPVIEQALKEPAPPLPMAEEVEMVHQDVSTLQPLGLKDMLRIVVFGGDSRLGGHVQFAKAFTVKPVGQIAVPEHDFEAGICAAAADILIFDLVGIDFGEMLDRLSTAEQYVPRAVVVALLEPKTAANSIPQCGVHLTIPEPFSPESVAKAIEHLMFGV